LDFIDSNVGGLKGVTYHQAWVGEPEIDALGRSLGLLLPLFSTLAAGFF